MTTDQVNYLNIGLMGISLVAAFLLPVEVFLFSYAILGPLHYLTEISWLHDRQYFAPKKLDWVPLAVLGILILLGAKEILGDDISAVLEGMGLGGVLDFLGTYAYDITFLAFGLALVLIVFKKLEYRLAAIGVLLIAAYLFHVPDSTNPRRALDKYDSAYWKIFAVYLPTLIHVYLFTGAFIIFGALKRNSRSGYISFAVFVLCAIACFVLFPESAGYSASDGAVESYSKSFLGLSHHMLMDLGGYEIQEVATMNIFTHPASIVMARFIAFAYTYHYLNWFSKTSVIRWHKVPKARFMIVIAAWVASIALYVADYQTGFRWLFLLSFLHVLLEFPLNHKSFIGIGEELYARFGGGKKQAAKS
ncbi:MAG: hypothetical protein AAF570_17715 [Bacteroidota bacterium]